VSKYEILSHLPVETFKYFFNTGSGHPAKELLTVLDVLLLQETLDLTVRETLFTGASNKLLSYSPKRMASFIPKAGNMNPPGTDKPLTEKKLVK
jgi:hypothetical protein